MIDTSPRKSRLAIWSLVAGIAGVVCPVVGAVPAIVCGHIARSKIKSSAGSLSGKGLALAGLILGYLGIVIAATSLVVFQIQGNRIRDKFRQATEELGGAGAPSESSVDSHEFLKDLDAD